LKMEFLPNKKRIFFVKSYKLLNKENKVHNTFSFRRIKNFIIIL